MVDVSQGIPLFFEVGLVIVVASVLAYIGKILRQPSIIAYILAGIVIGPVGFKLIESSGIISLFSELGIMFLLFIVGLQLDIKKLKGVGRPSVVIGLGQILFTSVFGYIIARQWFDHLPALYIAIALTLSSTVVVVKLYLDLNQMATLHARIALGVLLLQDLFAIFALVYFSTLGQFTPSTLAFNAARLVLFLATTIIIAWHVIPKLFSIVARSLELLFLAALSWAFIVAMSADYLNLSPAAGAFIAGITLASTPYALEISGRIKSLRDFFVTIFFVSLGMQILPETLRVYAVPSTIFSLFVLIGNPIIMLIITAAYGYHKRTAFLTSISLAQISEFSLVLVALGFSLGHISADIVAIIATIATLTISVSTYFIVYNEKLYGLCKPLLRWKSKPHHELEYGAKADPEVLLCGYNRMGYSILRKLNLLKKKVFVIDYNPDVITHLIEKKIPSLYGDVTDMEVLHHIRLKKIKLCISTIPTFDDNALLLKRLKKVNRDIRVVLTAQRIEDAMQLYEKGADYVIVPHYLSGQHVAFLIEDFQINRFVHHKKRHLKELKNHPHRFH